MDTKIIILCISAILFLISAFLVVKKNAFVINLNRTVEAFMKNHESPFVFNFFSIITKLGDVLGASGIIVIIGLFLARNNITFFEIFTLAAGFGVLLPFVIKLLTRIPRPTLILKDFSFPSGHATISMVFLFSFIFLLIPLVKSEISQYSIFLTAVTIFPLVALSRIYLSVHWISDVIAGVFLGTICFLSAELLLL